MAHCSAKLDEVSRNCILEEAIRREERTMRLNTEFTVSDPRKSRCKCAAAAAQPLFAGRIQLQKPAALLHAEYVTQQLSFCIVAAQLFEQSYACSG
jgi:hypothetical protein